MGGALRNPSMPCGHWAAGRSLGHTSREAAVAWGVGAMKCLMPVRLRARSARLGSRPEGVFAGRTWPLLFGVLEMKQRVTVQRDVFYTFMDFRYTPA
jgi:hypothetical protein